MVRLPSFHRAIIAERTIYEKIFWSAAAILCATALRWIIDRGASGAPFVTYFPAVVLVSLFIGWRWGCLAAVLAAIIGNRMFRPGLPITQFDAADFIMAGFFAFSCAILIIIGHTVRRLLSKLEAAHARERLLNEELRHRGRNILAVTRSIANLTYRNSDPADFLTCFTQRLEALARANDLAAESDGPISLARIISEALAPFQHASRFKLAGPDIAIDKQARVPLMLALHELCTNAAKYGALSNDDGWIEIGWDRDSATASIRWRERNGPPVSPPSRKGLGSALLRSQRGLPSIALRFPAGGAECEIKVKLSDGE